MTTDSPRQKSPSCCTALQLRCLSGFVLLPFSLLVLALGGWILWGLVVFVGALSASEWIRIARAGPAPLRDLPLGLGYLAVCFGAFVFIREVPPDGVWYATGLVLAVAASDTGAYFTGKAIGGPKLAPVISPNKTWAGFGGAVFFCGLTLWGLAVLCLWQGVYLPVGPYGLAAFGAGMILGAAGQVGDLFISLHKRRAGLKDSGHIIPGHGGILDRIDSLLLTCPTLLILLLAFD